MDAGLAAIIAAIVGGAIGAAAGIGGAFVQARSTREAARESDERRRAAEATDRIRTFRIRSIEQTRLNLSSVLDFLELAASGRTAEAAARDQQFWAEPSSRVMNLSLLGDDGMIGKFFELKTELDARSGGDVADVARIQNMRILVMSLLDIQERAALADEPPFTTRPPASTIS